MIRFLLSFVTVFLLSTSLTSGQSPVFTESFTGGKLSPEWEVHCSEGNEVVVQDGLAEIRADLNTYAHISKPLGTDCVTLSARIKPSQPSGISWCTAIYAVWNASNWCQIGVIDAPDGQRFYVTETEDSRYQENYLATCNAGEWQHLRIEIGRNCIRYYGSSDGSSWQCLRTIERPTQYVGAPNRLIVGKGFSRGTAPYDKPDLDNDYTERGGQVVSQIGGVLVERTASDKLLLSARERREIAEAGLDPVGKTELQGATDPSYERVAAAFPPMKYSREAVSVPEHPDDIGVDYLGRLQFTSNINASNYPSAWFEIGDPPAPVFSEKEPIQRKLLSGWMPVVVLSARQGNRECEQTVFGWSKGWSTDAELFSFLRLRILALPGSSIPDKVMLVVSDKQRIPFVVKTRNNIGEVCLKIPYKRPGDAVQIDASQFQDALVQTASLWRAKLSRGFQFEVPDAHINNAIKAWLAYSLLDVDTTNGYPEPHDGMGFYEEIYGYSASLYCIALDLYGMHNEAQRYLDTLLHFQQPDGLYTQNFGLPDQGALLMALSEHYNLTGDRKWLQRVSGNMIRACEWLVRKRKAAPETGIARGLIKFRPYCDYPEPVYNYYADTYCCVGLEYAAKALDALGMKAEANRFAVEAENYRKDILASMEKAAIHRDGRIMLPIEPETHRLLKDSHYTGGDYYGLVASSLLENGFLPASDFRARWITDLMEQKNGLLTGVCRFGPGGIDHAYTYGYLMTQLKRGDARKVILGLYGMLAFGMTRDTYSGVECTTVVSGSNFQTLPHLYSATQQLRLLRMMLLREEGDSLYIGDAIPREWLQDGRKIKARKAPTQFGDLSFNIESKANSSRIEVTLDPPVRRAPKLICLRLRHPDQKLIKSVSVNGRKWNRFSRETINLSGIGKAVKIIVDFQ